MPKKKASHFETFTDGLLTICEADTDRRTITADLFTDVRYGQRTVGVQRFWQAKTAGDKVDRLVAIPAGLLDVGEIHILDMVLLNADQYQIRQIQLKPDTAPPAVYLSLEYMVHPYKDRRENHGNSN